MSETTTPDRPETVRLLGRPHLIAACKVDVELPEGLTVGQMLDQSGLHPKLAPWCRVAIDGRELDPVAWDWVKPKAGHLVTVSVVPAGSSNGDSNKTLRTVLTIVVLVAAAAVSGGALAGVLGPSFAAGAWGATVGGALVAAGGLLLVTALLPPAFQRRAAQDGSQQSPSIAGTRNAYPGFGAVVPRVYGRHRALAGRGGADAQ